MEVKKKGSRENRQSKRYGTAIPLPCLGVSVKVCESMQGSGSKGDAVLYNTWLLGLDWRGEGREKLGGEESQVGRGM